MQYRSKKTFMSGWCRPDMKVFFERYCAKVGPYNGFFSKAIRLQAHVAIAMTY